MNKILEDIGFNYETDILPRMLRGQRKGYYIKDWEKYKPYWRLIQELLPSRHRICPGCGVIFGRIKAHLAWCPQSPDKTVQDWYDDYTQIPRSERLCACGCGRPVQFTDSGYYQSGYGYRLYRTSCRNILAGISSIRSSGGWFSYKTIVFFKDRKSMNLRSRPELLFLLKLLILDKIDEHNIRYEVRYTSPYDESHCLSDFEVTDEFGQKVNHEIHDKGDPGSIERKRVITEGNGIKFILHPLDECESYIIPLKEAGVNIDLIDNYLHHYNCDLKTSYKLDYEKIRNKQNDYTKY